MAVNINDLKNYTFEVPSTLKEQQAIASVLSSIDNEIAALEAKRKKYEAVKQGMMQQLLTGKIRLL
jgi:type I restriction enzyme S subunit